MQILGTPSNLPKTSRCAQWVKNTHYTAGPHVGDEDVRYIVDCIIEAIVA